MVRLITGRAGSKKSESVIEEIRRLSLSGFKNIVLMVPEQFTVSAERELLDRLGNRLADGIEILNFTRMTDYVFARLGGRARRYITEGGRMIIMRRTLDAVKDKLRAYSDTAEDTKFIATLLAAADELKDYNISPGQLEKSLCGLSGMLYDKVFDLSLIYETYCALLAAEFADAKDDLLFAAEKIDDEPIFKGWRFYFDAYKSFTPAQMNFIEKLLPQVEAVFILTGENLADKSELSLFKSAAETAEKIKRLCETLSVPLMPDTILKQKENVYPPAIAHLERTLFRARPEPFAALCPELSLVKSADIYAEAEFAALDILRKRRELGRRWRDFAIITRNLSDYEGILDGVFSKYGIPLYLDRRKDIMSMPLTTLIFSAFRCALGGFSHRNIFGYLKSGLTDIKREETDELENYAYKWGIKGSGWTQEKPWSFHPDGFNKELDDFARQRLLRLDDIRRRAVGSLLKFKKKLAQKDAGGISLAVYELLCELRVQSGLEDYIKKLRSRGLEAAALENEQLWELVIQALDEMASVCKEPITAQKYAELLELMLSAGDIGTIPTAIDEVTAGSADRIRTHDIKSAYVLGFCEGDFPKADFDEGLFTDVEKRLLEQEGIALSPSHERLAYDERFLVYCAFTAASEDLTISYPLADSAGKEKRPSYVAVALLEIFKELKVGDAGEPLLKAESRRAAFDAMLSNPGEPFSKAAFNIFKNDPEYARKIEDTFKAASLMRGELQIAPETAARLYADRAFSPTRLERYSKCAFAHFCEYGLQLKPLEKIELTPVDSGTFMHYVTENYIKKHGVDISKDTENRVSAIVKSYIKENLKEFSQMPARFQLLFLRLTRIVSIYIENLCEEFSNAKFRPLDLELKLGKGGEVEGYKLPGGVEISGKIDRVDGYERDGHLYLRVVDYKSGEKKFDHEEILCGLGLQMLLYLFALCENAKGYYGKEISPAGVLYSPIRLTAISVKSTNFTEEKIKRMQKEQSKATGILTDEGDILLAMDLSGEFRLLPLKARLSDGELIIKDGVNLAGAQKMEALKKYISRLIQGEIAQISAGDVSINPVWKESKGINISCTYCRMSPVCRYEDREDRLPPRIMSRASAEEFWARILSQEGGGG